MPDYFSIICFASCMWYFISKLWKYNLILQPMGKSSWRYHFPIISFQYAIGLSPWCCAAEGGGLQAICVRWCKMWLAQVFVKKVGTSSEHQIAAFCSSLNESASQPSTLQKAEGEGMCRSIVWAAVQSLSCTHSLQKSRDVLVTYGHMLVSD